MFDAFLNTINSAITELTKPENIKLPSYNSNIHDTAILICANFIGYNNKQALDMNVDIDFNVFLETSIKTINNPQFTIGVEPYDKWESACYAAYIAVLQGINDNTAELSSFFNNIKSAITELTKDENTKLPLYGNNIYDTAIFVCANFLDYHKQALNMNVGIDFNVFLEMSIKTIDIIKPTNESEPFDKWKTASKDAAHFIKSQN